MKNQLSNKVSKIGKRTFTVERIPVSSVLGRVLIYGKDSERVIKAVRIVAKDGGSSNVTLKNVIKKSSLQTSK
jgi:hypothetical protein